MNKIKNYQRFLRTGFTPFDPLELAKETEKIATRKGREGKEMKYTEGKIGRIFVVRLEDGDKLPEAIESFAQENSVSRGMCILVGGIKNGGKIVVGPEDSEAMPVVPMIFGLKGVHEICAVGTIFPDRHGKPRLHMHAALGREGKTRSGCIRPGIEVWKLGEVIVLEITETTAHRKEDAEVGFNMLEP